MTIIFIFQKAKRRRGAIEETSFSDEKKKRAQDAMLACYMSSEEEDEGGMVIRPLEWESKKLRKMKKKLDKQYKKSANKKSTAQLKDRRRGEVSARPAPTVCEDLSWIIDQATEA